MQLKKTVFLSRLIASAIVLIFAQGIWSSGNAQTTRQDTFNLKFPFRDVKSLITGKTMSGSPLYLSIPASIQQTIEYDHENNEGERTYGWL